MDSHDDANRNRSPRRRRLQFGLRSLMIVVLLICLALGRHVERVRRQREAVAELTEAGASIVYYLSDADPFGDGTAAIEKPRSLAEWIEWSTPVRLRAALGIDFFRHVEWVDLGGWAVDYAPALRRLRDLPGLRRLTLNSAVDEDLAFVGAIRTLTYLDVVSASTITDAGLAHLSRLQKLEHLELPYNPISDAGLAHLAGLRRLKHLDLSTTNIGDAGLSHLAEMPELEFLDVDRTKITDEGMLHLARLRGMKHLDVSSNAIGDAGFSMVAKLPDLEYLNVSETLITDEGLKALRPRASLNELDLDRTAITDAGLRIVGDLGSLKTVSIRGTAATREDAAWLRQRLPNTGVGFRDDQQKHGASFDLQVLMRAGLWRKALEAIDTLPKPFLNYPLVQLDLARCHAELACWDKAEFEYRAVLERGLSPWERSRDTVWQEILAWPELFERVARGFPNDVTRWVASADRAVVEGRWSAAADDYARAVECLQSLGPAIGDENRAAWIESQYGASQIMAGDLPEFRRVCARLAKANQRWVERNAKLGISFNDDSGSLDDVTLVAPQGALDASQIEVWSKAAASSRSESPGLRSLMYCRIAKFEKVFEQERPNGQFGDDDCGRFWFSRAMAHQHLGRPAQARECFTRGTQWLGRRMKIARLRGDYYVVGDLLEAEALRREAKRLIFE